MKYKGKMDVVPASILHSLIKACSSVFNFTNNEEEMRVFASILEIILNPGSYSNSFCALKQKKVSTNAREQHEFHNWINIRRTVGVSYYSTSPLLHDIINDGKAIPAIVKQIQASESDETLSVFGKILFHFARLAEKGEFNLMAEQGFFDGIKILLVQCDSIDCLHFTLSAIIHCMTRLKHLTYKLCTDISKELRSLDFIHAVLAIALGLRKRSQLHEKNAKEYQNFYLYSRMHSEEEFISKYFSNDHGCEMTRRKKTRETQSKKKTATQTKKNIKKMTDSKRKQKNQKIEMPKGEEDLIIIEDDKSGESFLSSSSSSTATEQCYGDSSNEKHVRLPLNIRLEAARIIFSLDFCGYSTLVPKRMLMLLSEGLELPEGAEEEYLSQKTKELKEKEIAEKEEKKRIEELEKKAAKKKRKRKSENLPDKLNEKTEDKKEKEEKEDKDCSYADTIANAESCDTCKKSIPLTACDTTENLKQVQETLLSLARFFKLNVNQRSNSSYQEIPELILTKLFDRLNRLKNFPLNRFNTLACSCIELLFSLMPNSMLFRCLPSVEEQIVSDLCLIEKEMIEAKSNDSTLSQSPIEFLSNSENDELRLNKIFLSFPNDLGISALEPSFENCLTASDYDKSLENYICALSVRAALSFRHISNFNFGLNFDVFIPRNYEEINLRSQQLHYSLTAYRLNHNTSCILSAISSNQSYADEIILRPFFRFLMSKLSYRFPVRAAASVKYSENRHYFLSSLESVPITICEAVAIVLMNTVKELPYAFETGYVTRLLEWMAGLSPCSPELLMHGIIQIREAATLFSLPSRKIRLELEGSSNEEIKGMKNKTIFEKYMFRSNFCRNWNGISNLEIEKCIPHSIISGEELNKNSEFELLDFTEDEEEVQKQDDTGTLLYCRLEDLLEETGIRDLLETFPQGRSLEPFWIMKGTIPTKPKDDFKRTFYNFNYEVLQRGPNLQMRSS
ncbi:uncharacterized protein MONOS_13280 [Monocercomonoides exilis]|uniref:uncharacterized protein n=1 Tax=Monocercomonoides exilis TaxID=2049356 RepID=UPI00355ACA2F|nr:hypothetical protein MONOS_13280 [Monocercomonoides exilis]|eukprot:MONOS_13280.1-p1 / transcript=MONOS_13280.1 / gene=MONOS_13280 / organism=Monocercomonoides_exilis_PA203 / gene_product=unspecified product / transcript_product=unspecified product / location=Mono_scaffold00803:17652-20814(+) / protein_length=964 / sequence_SO=supercontig / SO=protein_coding / is_pseudo=false